MGNIMRLEDKAALAIAYLDNISVSDYAERYNLPYCDAVVHFQCGMMLFRELTLEGLSINSMRIISEHKPTNQKR